MKALSLAALALVAFSAVACASKTSSDETAEVATGEVNTTAAITIENWLTHPKIVAVRDVVNEIDAASENDLKTESKAAKELCEESGHGEMERTKLTDPSGVIRELVLGYGSEDSAQTESHYYDKAGKLRFVFTTKNDVHGNSSEMRTYFDESGARIWDIYRHAFDENLNANVQTAPYELPSAESKAEIDPAVFTPAERYNAPAQCD
jgi:hypothetical protein